MSSPERYKGHDAVLNAWPLIRAAVPAAELVVIGTGADEPRLKRRVRDERLQGIEFRGRVSDEERDRAYCSSRLLFYPSEQEGFGLAGIEAASFGVPFLGLRGTVAAELFPDGNSVVLASDLRPKSIAEASDSGASRILHLPRDLETRHTREFTAHSWKIISQRDFDGR